jgi:hypothetical protein
MQPNATSVALLESLGSLRDALNEMALVLSDYQYEMDANKRLAAQEQVISMLKSFNNPPANS